MGGSQPVNPMTGTGQSGLEPSNPAVPVGTAIPRPFATSQPRGPEPGNSSPPLKKQRIDSRQEPVQLQRHADPQLQRIIPNPRFAQYQHQQPQALQQPHMHQQLDRVRHSQQQQHPAQIDRVRHSQPQQHPAQIDRVRHSQQQQHPVQPSILPNDPPVGDLCARRVSQYINHQPVNPMTGTGQSGLEPSNPAVPVGTAIPRPFATSQPTGPEPGNPSPPLKKQRIDSRQEPVQLQRHADPQLQRIIPNPRFAQYQHQQPQALQQPHMHQQLDRVRHSQQQQHPAQIDRVRHSQQQQHPAQIDRVRHSQPQQHPAQIDRVRHSQQQQHPARIDRVRHSQQQQHPVQPPILPNDPPVGDLCARRVSQYINHQRNCPPDNSILYWRKFVAEYFAPVAKKSWCLAALDNGGSHAVCLPSQTTTDTWKCLICGAKSQNGFEATYDILPRFFQVISGHGAIDEVLSLGTPPEQKSLSGFMILEYANAVQESIYEHHRVSHKGKLRIIFTPDLKILSWEFCIRDHEDLFSRTLVASKVNEFLQVAQKCQTVVTEENGSAGLLPQELQTSWNMVVTAGHQLAKSLEPPSLNDLCFPKVFIRSLEVANVVNTMKDLFDFNDQQDLLDFNNQHYFGPIESLKRYPRVSAMLREEKMQEAGQMATAQCLPADHNTSDRTGSGDGGTGTVQMATAQCLPADHNTSDRTGSGDGGTGAVQMATAQCLPTDHNTSGRTGSGDGGTGMVQMATAQCLPADHSTSDRTGSGDGGTGTVQMATAQCLPADHNTSDRTCSGDGGTGTLNNTTMVTAPKEYSGAGGGGLTTESPKLVTSEFLLADGWDLHNFNLGLPEYDLKDDFWNHIDLLRKDDLDFSAWNLDDIV